MPPVLDEDSVAELRQDFPAQPFRLEVDLYGLTTIQEKEDPRPYLGYHLMVVEAESGFITGADILIAKPSLEEMWVQVPMRLLNAVTSLGGLPSEIVVRSERLHYLLAPVAGQLGIRLLVSRRLPALDQARRSFERMM
jgi:hypothetical protein